MIDCIIFFVRKIQKKETEIPEKNTLSKIVLILNETFRKFPVVLCIHVFNTQILNCIPTTCISFFKNSTMFKGIYESSESFSHFIYQMTIY